MPALAPSRQRRPMLMVWVPPPDRVPMDRRAAADVAVVADHDAGADPALDHGGTQRARVVVAEALVHDRGALGQVGAEPDPVGVGDPHPGGDHVVGHPRELVDAGDLEREAVRAGAQPYRGGLGRQDRAQGGPGNVGQQAEHAVQAGAVRLDEPVAEQVQPQPDVVGVGGRGGQVGDVGAHRDDLDAAQVVRAEGLRRVRTEPGHRVVRGQRGWSLPGGTRLRRRPGPGSARAPDTRCRGRCRPGRGWPGRSRWRRAARGSGCSPDHHRPPGRPRNGATSPSAGPAEDLPKPGGCPHPVPRSSVPAGSG